MRQRTSRRWGAATLAVALLVPVVATALTAGISGGATVDAPATRGTAAQVTDTVPRPPGCRRVAVVGDSLMDNAEPWLRAELRDAGFDHVVDAQPSRRIPARVRAPYSGVQAALEIRTTFGEADCWVVALGSNDLIFGGDRPDEAAAMIDEMLAALTPGSPVWWVNVNYRRDPRTSFDFVGATRVFNAALDARAAASPGVTVIDWYTLSAANPDWFFDPVHVDRAASIVRAEFTVAALPPAR